MEQKDYLQNQIEQLSFFLKKLLANILALKSGGNEQDVENLVSNELTNELNFDVNEFKLLSKYELKSYLQKFNFNENHIEKLAEIFIEMSSLNSNTVIENQNYISKAIELLELADENSNSFSVERSQTKTKLLETFKSLEN